MLIPLRKINEIPKTLNVGAIDRAIHKFVSDSRINPAHTNIPGLIQQLTDVIAGIIIFKNLPQNILWLAEKDGEVAAWVICHVSKDVDNSLCYWMTDAWVDKSLRGNKEVKQWYQLLREDAKHFMCKHILIPSSRNTKAYLRFLGHNWHKYLEILKEDI